jgi:hypothetical protein
MSREHRPQHWLLLPRPPLLLLVGGVAGRPNSNNSNLAF